MGERSEPFIHCYTKCEAFCWFSRWLDKRSFSLLPKAKAICCEATAGNLSLSWVGKKEKLKFGFEEALESLKIAIAAEKNKLTY